MLFPKFTLQKWWGKNRGEGRPLNKAGKFVGTMENERIAKKLRDPEAYYLKWRSDKDYLNHKEQALREWREKNWGKEQIFLNYEVRLNKKNEKLKILVKLLCMNKNCKAKSKRKN